MSATSDRPRALRASFRFLALALLAFAGTATAQTPPYFINAFGAPTTTTVQEGQTFTPVVRVTDGSGTPVQGWTVDWTVSPGGSIAATTTTSTAAPAVLGGVASNSFTNYVSGTYTISASTFDGNVILTKVDPGAGPTGTAGPVTFTVNVENVGMAVVDPPGGKDVILTNAVRALQVYWGSASIPTAGTTINWSIISEPGTGAGTLGTPTVTSSAGFSTVNFSGAVPGDYTIRAAEFGCTWCGPTFQDFIITVVDPAADMHAIISDAPDPVDPGATISYDIGVGNNGPDAAASASWSFTTPADTVFESFVPAGSWSCSTPAAGATGTVTCTQASLPSGAADLFTLVVRVTGSPAPGSLINAVVTTTTATTDVLPTNDSAGTDTTVGSVVALSLVKTLLGTTDNDSSSSTSIGDQLDYSVVATNTGNAPLTNVVVSDDKLGAGTANCPTLAAGAQCAIFAGYIVTAADEQAGQIVNTGSVTSTEIPGPQTDTVTTTVVLIPAPDMAVTKVLLANADGDGSTDVTEGDVLTYEVTATNTGNIPLSNVFVTDDHFAATQTCASVPVSGTCVLTGDYTVTAADVAATQVNNTGTATADEIGAPITGSLGTPVFFHSNPSMTLVKVLASTTDNDSSTTVTEGDTLHYTVTATNTGNVTLLNLQIDDAQLTPSFEVCSGVSPGGTCVFNGDYVVTQGDAAFGQVDNTATAISAELPTPLSSNTVTTTVAGTPAMTVVKVLTGSFDFDGTGDVSVGDELYYDVTATNSGTTTLNNVVVSDDHYGGTQACATLAPNGTCVLNVIYTVQPSDAIAGEVVNIGSAVSDEFPTAITYSVATGVAAGPPVLNIVSGDNSAGYGGQSATLVVSLIDQQGNPTLAGQTITWTGANNSTSVVQPDGTSTNTVSFNGTTGFVTVTAAFLPASLEVQFNLQSVSASLLVNSGNNQTAPAGTVVPNPLEVLALDDNNPTQTSIVWTVTGDATVSPVNGGTDIDGLASTIVTLGASQGPVFVQAQRTDSGETAVFTVNAAAPVRTLQVHDGNFQSGSPGATLPLNLVVEARDNGVGIDGAIINFAVIDGSDAQVGTCCGTTAGGGFAGTSLTLRTTPGPVVVRASRADDPTVFVDFNATAQTRGLVYLAGDNQSAATGATMTDLLAVQSQLDGAGEANITIDWSTNATAATLTPVDNPTDASGNGSAQVTCGATAETFNVVAARFDDPSLSVTFTATCTAPVTRTLSITSGNFQTGSPGATLPSNLVVAAQDNGVGADGVGINFAVIGGSDAQVGANSVTTSGGGVAGTSLTLRTSPGPVVVRASRADDPTVFVDFNATAQTRGLVYLSGDNQSAATGAAMTDLLAVQSQLDGAGEANITIDWSTNATAATLTPVDNPTDASGNGTAQLTCGATAETFNVVAARFDDPSLSVTFTATCTLTRTLVITSGNNQSGAPGAVLPSDLVVEAKDNGVGSDGVGINFSVVGGSDAQLGSTTATTAGGGFAGTTLTLRSSAGPVQVRAERADDPSVFVVFDATALSRGLVAVSGDAQTAALSSAMPALLTVESQLGGAAQAGIGLTWTNNGNDLIVVPVVNPTDVNGLGSAQLTCGTTPGVFGISVSRDDNPTITASFTATCATPNLTVVAGDNQTGDPNQPGTPLVVELRDGTPANNVVANAPIFWGVTSGDAALDAGNSTTGPDGRTTMGFTFGSAGTTVFKVHDGGYAAADITVTALALPTLTVVSGNGQMGLANTVADDPLVVRLLDGNGNPIANAVVDWSATGAGTVTPVSPTTNGLGEASATLTFAATAGGVTITATQAGAAAPATFVANALDAEIGIGSGNNQTGPVNTTLPLPLTVLVAEPVPANAAKGHVGAQALDGVPVTFTVATGGGSVTATTVLTDATGHAATQFTLGPVEGAQTVTASVVGGASVTFTATATVARTLVLVSGDGQNAAPGAALPAPLVVHAQDNGADVGGVDINWVVTGPASVTPSGATTSAGIATATVTLGATPGAVSIRAERADDPTVFVVFNANTAKIQDIPGLTPEERELAIVIDETCATLAGMASLTPQQQDFLARCQELSDGSVIDPGAVTDALDELLPGLALAMQEASFNAAQAQFQNLKARIAALRSGTQGSSFQGLALNNSSGTVSLGSLGAALTEDGGEPAKPSGGNGSDFQRWGFFASGTIGRGEAEAGSTRPAYDYDINGLTVGLDYRYSDNFIFGGALGYTRQDSELRDSPGNMDMSGWSVSGYATWYRDNSWYTDAVLTYGHNNFDLLRTISYTVPLPGGGSSSVSQTARSNSDGDLLEGAFTFGRDFQAGGWSIGPYGRLLYTKLEFDRIVDDMASGPGSGLGLEIDARSLTSVASEMGAKFTYAHSTDWGVVTPHLQLEWEHEFKDDPRALTARFLADPNSTPFSLSGEAIDTDFFRLSLGLSIIMQRGRSGFLIYERTVGRDGFFQDNLGFGVRIEF